MKGEGEGVEMGWHVLCNLRLTQWSVPPTSLRASVKRIASVVTGSDSPRTVLSFFRVTFVLRG